MSELISVVVPVYNARSCLRRCVESICAQTYRNLEILLVDDGSADGSGELCDKLQIADSRIHVIHQENQGSTAARNAGLRRSAGSYIGFVDSDDWIEPDMYEMLYKGCKECMADICVGRQYLDRGATSHVEKPRSIVSGVLEKKDGEMPHHIIYSDDYANRGISPNLCDKLFARDLLLKHQFQVDIRTKFAEDDICVYSALLDANRVALLDCPVYHYCRHEESVTHRSDHDYFEKITIFYRQMKSIFDQQEQARLLLEKLDRYMMEFVLRGLNRSFGFPFGVVVPYFVPPFHYLQERGMRRIVLYGAGDVGMDYWRSFQVIGILSVVLWVDMRWKEFSGSRYPVAAPEHIREVSGYDAILLATESFDLMERMERYLVNNLDVPSEKIVKKLPVKFIETLENVNHGKKCEKNNERT